MMWLVQWLVQGSALAVIATVAVRLMPVTSPRPRHLFWWLVLAGLLALPWLPVLIAPPGSSIAVTTAQPRAAFEVTAPPAWLTTVCLAAWGSMSFLALLSLLADLRAQRTLKRSCWPLSCLDASPVTEPLHALAAAVRGTRVVLSDDVAGACAAGYFAPRVIVSSRLASSLEPAALESVVRHELAHLERYDDWLRLVQRLVLAVTGLHPAVRWVSRHIDIEREAACDRLVVECTGDPRVYALALTSAAELMAGRRQLAPRLAPGASVSSGGLRTRVERLLADGRPDSRRVRTMVAASVGICAVALIGIARVPPLVVVASLEPPVRAVLGSLPAGRTLLPRVPVPQGRAFAFASAPRDAATPQAAVPGGLAGPSSTQVTDVEAPVEEPRVDVALSADALDVPIRRDLRLTTALAPGSQPAVAATTVGARAARAGSAAGNTAARAGSAIGRFFSSGGQAVAGRF